MDDALELELSYDGKELNFPLRLYKYGYTYRIEVMINQIPLIFEPDEEGSYRVINEGEPIQVDITLLSAIAEKLKSLR